MNERGKNVLTAALYTGVGIGLVYIIGKNRKILYEHLKRAWNFRDPLRNKDVRIVNNIEECRDVVKQIKM